MRLWPLCWLLAIARAVPAGPPPSPPPDAAPLQIIAAGTLGSLLGEIAAYPCDQLKTQVLAGSPVLAAATMLARERGVRGIYAGLPSPLVGAFFVKSVVFAAREFWKRVLRHLSVARFAGALSAFGAGAVASLVVAPVERVKILVQLQGGDVGSAATFARLWRDGGLFVGVGATCWREAPTYAAYFSIYEEARAAGLGAAIAGGLAGALSWLLVIPIDVAKTRVQSGDARHFLPALAAACARPAHLAQSAGPTVARALVKHAVVFVAYEAILDALLRDGGASTTRKAEL